MKETEEVEQFLSNIGIRCQRAEDINYKDIPCDYIGFDNDYWYIVELKTNKEDCERSILQLVRYFDALKWSKYNQNAPSGYKVKSGYNKRIYAHGDTTEDYKKLNHRTKEEIPRGKKDIRLFLLYTKYIGIGEFEKYHSLFKTYLDNPNCPNIDFYYLDENKPIKL